MDDSQLSHIYGKVVFHPLSALQTNANWATVMTNVPVALHDTSISMLVYSLADSENKLSARIICDGYCNKKRSEIRPLSQI